MDTDTASPAGDRQSPRVSRVLDGDALRVRVTPYGSVGTVFACRWPRGAAQATVFSAAYSPDRLGAIAAALGGRHDDHTC